VAFMRSVTQGEQKWPESIDFDRRGNLYFTDHDEKALFRIKRNQDGTLADSTERLLYGFRHAGGISIDRDKDILYLGARVKRDGGILCIPLKLLAQHRSTPYSSFREEFLANHPQHLERMDTDRDRKKASPSQPNGVVYDPSTGTIFYTHSNIVRGWLGFKGFLGNTENSLRRALRSPNGIDIDPTRKDTLVISLFWKNCILRLDTTNGAAIKSPVFGKGLDGLLCLENGDVIATSFGSGEIFHLSWDGSKYVHPTVLQNGLDCPTDIAIGPSASGSGESLYVTTTKGLVRSWFGGGEILEIPKIRELIR